MLPYQVVQVGTTAGPVMDPKPPVQAAGQSAARQAQQPRYAPPRPPGNGYGLDPEAAAALQGQFRQGLRIRDQNNAVDFTRMAGKINANEQNRSQAARANAGYQMAQTGLQGYAQQTSQDAQRREQLIRALFGLQG